MNDKAGQMLAAIVVSLIVGASGGWYFTQQHYKPLLTESKDETSQFRASLTDLQPKYDTALEQIKALQPAPVVAAPTPAPSQLFTPPQNSERTGATCRDGTHSNATGSGACSGHRGVSEWLY